MPILSHGSDVTLAPTIRPIVRQVGGTVRTAVDALSHAGFTAAQLDATLPGTRPRDLDTRARRDLLALLGRQNVRLAGLDLFIPRRHFTQTQHVDRAMAAATSAIELAADLGKVPVSLALPVKALTDEARQALVAAADGRGVRLAVHAEDQVEALLAWIEAVDLYALGAGLEPAAVLARGGDPVALAHRLGRRLAVARLDDLSNTSSDGSGDEGDDDESVRGAGVRSTVGEGDLDVASYRVALDLAAGRAGPVVLDLRGMENPLAGAAAAKAAWDHAAFPI